MDSMEKQNAHLSVVPSGGFAQLRSNNYQKAKARRIATSLIRACDGSSVKLAELPGIVARLSMDNWRTLSFSCGVPIADYTAKLLTVERLKKAAKS